MKEGHNKQMENERLTIVYVATPVVILDFLRQFVPQRLDALAEDAAVGHVRLEEARFDAEDLDPKRRHV